MKELGKSASFVKPVEIIDGLVRRPLAAWTPAVHGLLRHLESIGFEGVPQAVAVEEDRDVVTFVPGEVGHYPLNARQWSEGAIVHRSKIATGHLELYRGHIQLLRSEVFRT